MLQSVLEQVKAAGVVAVVRLDDLSQAVEITRALVAGGVTIIEFTLTNPEAVQAIATAREALGDICLIGAGSVIDTAGVDAVSDAGATFIVSPTTIPTVIERSHARDIPIMPGAYTPTEIQTAWDAGAIAVKVFPARQLGAKYIRDVLAPMPHLQLLPTGGVSASNAADYIRAGAVAVGAGGSLLDEDAIAAGNWDKVTADARELAEAVRLARR